MTFPLMVRAIRISLEGVDPGLEDAARTLGAGPWDRFFTITLPLMLPGILAGAVTAFAAGLGEFGAVITFVSNIPGRDAHAAAGAVHGAADAGRRRARRATRSDLVLARPDRPAALRAHRAARAAPAGALRSRHVQHPRPEAPRRIHAGRGDRGLDLRRRRRCSAAPAAARRRSSTSSPACSPPTKRTSRSTASCSKTRAARTRLPAERRRIGYVFQDARLFPHLDALGNLRYARAPRPRRREAHLAGLRRAAARSRTAPATSRAETLRRRAAARRARPRIAVAAAAAAARRAARIAGHRAARRSAAVLRATARRAFDPDDLREPPVRGSAASRDARGAARAGARGHAGRARRCEPASGSARDRRAGGGGLGADRHGRGSRRRHRGARRDSRRRERVCTWRCATHERVRACGFSCSRAM